MNEKNEENLLLQGNLFLSVEITIKKVIQEYPHAVIVNVVKKYHLVYNAIPQHFLLYQDMFS